jgi:hypothetical protein
MTHSVGRTMGLSNARNPADNTLLSARMHNARHLLRHEGGYVLSFALSDDDQEAEGLILVHDHAD